VVQNFAEVSPFRQTETSLGGENELRYEVGGDLATSVKSSVPESIRILVVDDSRTFRGFLHQLLTSFSSLPVVGEAEDGQLAIETASRLRPQVITMDIQMPRLDGSRQRDASRKPFQTSTSLACPCRMTP